MFTLKPEGASIIQKSSATCFFCKKSIDEEFLVGPFVRENEQAQQILESQDDDQI